MADLLVEFRANDTAPRQQLGDLAIAWIWSERACLLLSDACETRRCGV
jgi:hypothetical protein